MAEPRSGCLALYVVMRSRDGTRDEYLLDAKSGSGLSVRRSVTRFFPNARCSVLAPDTSPIDTTKELKKARSERVDS